MKHLLTVLIVCGVVICIMTSCGKEGYSEGDRYGQLTKFSHKGVICKSWEGELLLGGMKTTSDSNGNSSLAANVWQFSVRTSDESAVLSKLQEAANSGKRIKIHYSQAYIDPVCETSTDYFAKSVEILP